MKYAFVNREAAFSLFSASAALTGSLAADASPAAAFCVSGGGEYYAVSDDGAVRIFDATLGELKSFSVKADRIALSTRALPCCFTFTTAKFFVGAYSVRLRRQRLP